MSHKVLMLALYPGSCRLMSDMRRKVHSRLDRSDFFCAERVEFATVLAVENSGLLSK